MLNIICGLENLILSLQSIPAILISTLVVKQVLLERHYCFSRCHIH